MCCILWSFILKFLSNHPSMLFMPLPYISTNIQGQPSNWVKVAPSTLESALGVWRKTYGLGWQASSLDTLSNIDLAGTDHSSHCRTYSSCCWQSTTLLSQPHLLFLLPAETTPLQANGVGVVCYATLLLSPCWTARNLSRVPKLFTENQPLASHFPSQIW